MSQASFAPSQNFKGLWIPGCILFDDDLPIIRKVILSEIASLERCGERRCFASNAHFAKVVGCGERNVRDHLLALENAGLLHRSGSSHRTMSVPDVIMSAIAANCCEPVSQLVREPNATGEALPEVAAGRSDARASAPAGESSAAERRASRQRSAADEGCSNAAARQLNADAAGTASKAPAAKCRPMRQPSATEMTMSEQEEKTKERTSFEFPLPDWLPASDWKDWVDFNAEAGRTLTKKQTEVQISELRRLDLLGHPRDMVIRHAIENGYRSFYELPASKKPRSPSLGDGKRWRGTIL